MPFPPHHRREKTSGKTTEPDEETDQMTGQAKGKVAHKHVTKAERMMTDRESSELLESASQALAMIRGSKLVGGRISVRQAPLNHGHRIAGT